MHDERAMTPNIVTDYMRMLDSLELMLNHWEWVSAANEVHSKDGFLHVATQESKEKKRHLPNQYLSRRAFDKLEKQSAQASLRLQAHTCASQECDTCILLWKGYTHCVIEVSGLDASAYLLVKPPREDAYGIDGAYFYLSILSILRWRRGLGQVTGSMSLWLWRGITMLRWTY